MCTKLYATTPNPMHFGRNYGDEKRYVNDATSLFKENYF